LEAIMTWELVAIWAIVAGATIWFALDVRRQQSARQNEQLDEDARQFATAAAWRHRETEPSMPVMTYDPYRVTEIQRKVIEEMRRQAR
jgi:hypothetical protein